MLGTTLNSRPCDSNFSRSIASSSDSSSSQTQPRNLRFLFDLGGEFVGADFEGGNTCSRFGEVGGSARELGASMDSEGNIVTAGACDYIGEGVEKRGISCATSTCLF